METNKKTSDCTTKADEDVTADFTCWEKVSYRASNGLGMLFYKLGCKVASYPWTTILIAWLFVSLTSLGLLNLHSEENPLKLFVPQDSKLVYDTNWFFNSFQEIIRHETVIITASNVLAPSVLRKVAIISNEIMNLSTQNDKNSTIGWNDVCFKVPIIIGFVQLQNLFASPQEDYSDDDDEEDTTDEIVESETVNDVIQFGKSIVETTSVAKTDTVFIPSVHLPPDYFCGIINKLALGCLQENLLDLFKYNLSRINELSLDDVLTALNLTKTSPVTGHDMKYSHLLSGIERNHTGHIVSAKAMMIRWMVPVKTDSVAKENIVLGDNWVTADVLAWEAEFNRKMAELKILLDNEDFTVYYSAARSHADAGKAMVVSESNKQIIGCILMFIYMQLVLSKLSWVEARLVLGTCGLTSIGMALVSGGGIAAALGFCTSPIHTALAFLILGLGVDDMFVIIAALRQIQVTLCDMSLVEKVGLAMKNAGTSITITSLTDIIVFMVGASTVLPAFRSFCVYAALCILMIYLLVVTFFVAVLTLDEKRIEARRNAIIPCIIHSTAHTQPCFKKNVLLICMRYIYANFILTKFGKILIPLAVVIMTGLNFHSLLQLQQHFDPAWFIPQSHYHYNFYVERQQLFPDMGSESFVVMGQLNYTQDLAKIIKMSEMVENRTDILYDVQSWVGPFTDFISAQHSKTVRDIVLSDVDWRTYLTQFLFSSQGGRFQHNFQFVEKLQCGQPAPNITSSTIDFKFQNLNNREQYLPAKREIEKIVNDANLSTGEGYSTVWSKIFIYWLSNSIIDAEIFRNILLGLVGVMVCTAILIINFQMCFWILVTVLITMINIGGMMQRWGLTLDIVTCIALQISVGLCVDYAAHVGHTFLKINHGNRRERALETVLQIGPAVLYGATSTLLAFSVLGTAESYSYTAFFKICFLVTTFGVFHGLVLLPVILSQIGPDSYGGKKSRKHLPDLRTSSIFLIFSSKHKNNYDVTSKVVGNEMGLQVHQHAHIYRE